MLWNHKYLWKLYPEVPRLISTDHRHSVRRAPSQIEHHLALKQACYSLLLGLPVLGCFNNKLTMPNSHAPWDHSETKLHTKLCYRNQCAPFLILASHISVPESVYSGLFVCILLPLSHPRDVNNTRLVASTTYALKPGCLAVVVVWPCSLLIQYLDITQQL